MSSVSVENLQMKIC